MFFNTLFFFFFFFQAEDGIRDADVTGVQTCALPICLQHPLCYGMGKVSLAAEFLKSRGLSFSDCAFYTDSHADLPLLKKVAQPVVLNPNPELRVAAKEHQWPCIDWRHE